MFDRVEIVVKAGDGGNGAVSFRREKFVSSGGPDGGDGGKGGDIVVIAERSTSSLLMYKRRRHYKAEAGGNGQGKKKHGKNGEDLLLKVPVGTAVMKKNPGGAVEQISDLELPGQQAVIAFGGKGGLGNIHYASSTNQAPQIAQRGETGEERSIVLEMRHIADVGIIGYPNTGKSTLLSLVSAARPKIAGYPFTTLEPVLGVADVGLRSFVLAEIPGLIDGANLGRGLGHDFLRHAMRTRLFIHLIDGSSASPVQDMISLNGELGLFDSSLAQKPQLIAVNKIDLPQVREQLDEIKKAFKTAGTIAIFISAATGDGVDRLMAETTKVLEQVTAEAGDGKKVPPKIFHPRPRVTGRRIYKEGDVFVVVAPELERLIAGRGETVTGLHLYLRKQFNRLGVSKALEKAGIKPGDRVRCGDIELEW